MILEEDAILGQRYRLVKRLASGGMGEVWVAEDLSLARKVALKVLKPEFSGNEDFLMRLRTEARNAAGISHPNIAQLFDYGEQNGVGFLVMELIQGEPLSALLDRQPVLPPSRIIPVLSQAARGLHAAHVAGVVHRDIKPGNILLERGERVKITDFGVSLAANQIPMTASGMVMGTAQYLSPEQALGKPATASSDIYALGIVAYESLLGNRPFTGKTPVDIAVAHVNQQVPPLPPSVHPPLAALVMQMLEKEPAKRPRSAIALAAVLDDLLLDPAISGGTDPGTQTPLTTGGAHRAGLARPATGSVPAQPRSASPMSQPSSSPSSGPSALPSATPAAPPSPGPSPLVSPPAAGASTAPGAPPSPVAAPASSAGSVPVPPTRAALRSAGQSAPLAPGLRRSSSGSRPAGGADPQPTQTPWHEQKQWLMAAVGVLVVIILIVLATSGALADAGGADSVQSGNLRLDSLFNGMIFSGPSPVSLG